jgi:stearoyl-CoA desaturase (delta-9 desaturase)
MASVLPVSSPETTSVVSLNSIPAVDGALAAEAVRTVPARQEIRMGRAATTGDGVNWLTFSVIVLFHAGALAALFLFSWQRLVVMAALYVLAINVGIGMCYHRLLTHRGYQVPKWLEYAM